MLDTECRKNIKLTMKASDAHPGGDWDKKPDTKAMQVIVNEKKALTNETSDTHLKGAPVVAKRDFEPNLNKETKPYFDSPAFLKFLS